MYIFFHYSFYNASDDETIARQMLATTLKRFREVTGESVDVVYSWKGSLSVLGTDSYKSHVTSNKEEIWKKFLSRNMMWNCSRC